MLLRRKRLEGNVFGPLEPIFKKDKKNFKSDKEKIEELEEKLNKLIETMEG